MRVFDFNTPPDRFGEVLNSIIVFGRPQGARLARAIDNPFQP